MSRPVKRLRFTIWIGLQESSINKQTLEVTTNKKFILHSHHILGKDTRPTKIPFSAVSKSFLKTLGPPAKIREPGKWLLERLDVWVCSHHSNHFRNAGNTQVTQSLNCKVATLWLPRTSLTNSDTQNRIHSQKLRRKRQHIMVTHVPRMWLMTNKWHIKTPWLAVYFCDNSTKSPGIQRKLYFWEWFYDKTYNLTPNAHTHTHTH